MLNIATINKQNNSNFRPESGTAELKKNYPPKVTHFFGQLSVITGLVSMSASAWSAFVTPFLLRQASFLALTVTHPTLAYLAFSFGSVTPLIFSVGFLLTVGGSIVLIYQKIKKSRIEFMQKKNEESMKKLLTNFDKIETAFELMNNNVAKYKNADVDYHGIVVLVEAEKKRLTQECSLKNFSEINEEVDFKKMRDLESEIQSISAKQILLLSTINHVIMDCYHQSILCFNKEYQENFSEGKLQIFPSADQARKNPKEVPLTIDDLLEKSDVKINYNAEKYESILPADGKNIVSDDHEIFSRFIASFNQFRAEEVGRKLKKLNDVYSIQSFGEKSNNDNISFPLFARFIAGKIVAMVKNQEALLPEVSKENLEAWSKNIDENEVFLKLSNFLFEAKKREETRTDEENAKLLYDKELGMFVGLANYYLNPENFTKYLDHLSGQFKTKFTGDIELIRKRCKDNGIEGNLYNEFDRKLDAIHEKINETISELNSKSTEMKSQFSSEAEGVIASFASSKLGIDQLNNVRDNNVKLIHRFNEKYNSHLHELTEKNNLLDEAYIPYAKTMKVLLLIGINTRSILKFKENIVKMIDLGMTNGKSFDGKKELIDSINAFILKIEDCNKKGKLILENIFNKLNSAKDVLEKCEDVSDWTLAEENINVSRKGIKILAEKMNEILVFFKPILDNVDFGASHLKNNLEHLESTMNTRLTSFSNTRNQKENLNLATKKNNDDIEKSIKKQIAEVEKIITVFEKFKNLIKGKKSEIVQLENFLNSVKSDKNFEKFSGPLEVFNEIGEIFHDFFVIGENEYFCTYIKKTVSFSPMAILPYKRVIKNYKNIQKSLYVFEKNNSHLIEDSRQKDNISSTKKGKKQIKKNQLR